MNCNGVSVLHVDDEESFLDLASRFVECKADEIELETVSDPEEALELLEQESFDCVVCDYDMPGMTGLELHDRMVEKGVETPFVLYTGKADKEVLGQAIHQGVDDYVRKGGSGQYEKLIQAVKNQVEKGRSEEEVFLEESHESFTMFKFDEGSPRESFRLSEDSPFNSGLSKILGYEAGDLKGENAMDFVHPEDIQKMLSGFERFKEMEVGEEASIEFRMKSKSGGWRWLEPRIKKIKHKGEVKAVVTTRDITDRKDKTEAITSLQKVTEKLLSLDTRYKIIKTMVDAADKELGVEKAVYIDKTEKGFESVYPEVEVEEDVQDVDKPVFEGEKGFLPVFEGLLLVKTVSESFPNYMREALTILTSNASQALKRAERKKQNERLEEFADIVSHDIRNPVSVAQGYLSLMKQEGEDYFEEVEEALNRVENIVDDTLSLAKKGKIVEDAESFKLSRVVKKAAKSFPGLEIEYRGRERKLRGDRQRLVKMFENLFRNAEEHNSGDVSVTVGTEEDGFFVEDDGKGVPEDERQKVFEYSYSSEGQSGIGLSEVQKIVEAHDWSISLSESEKGGARFKIETEK